MLPLRIERRVRLERRQRRVDVDRRRDGRIEDLDAAARRLVGEHALAGASGSGHGASITARASRFDERLDLAA